MTNENLCTAQGTRPNAQWRPGWGGVQRVGTYVYAELTHFAVIETNTALQRNYTPIKIRFKKCREG